MAIQIKIKLENYTKQKDILYENIYNENNKLIFVLENSLNFSIDKFINSNELIFAYSFLCDVENHINLTNLIEKYAKLYIVPKDLVMKNYNLNIWDNISKKYIDLHFKKCFLLDTDVYFLITGAITKNHSVNYFGKITTDTNVYEKYKQLTTCLNINGSTKFKQF